MNFTNLAKKTNRRIGSALLNLALLAGTATAGNAASAYYSGRRGGYSGKNQSYLVDAGLGNISKNLLSAKRSMHIAREEASGSSKISKAFSVTKGVAIRELVIIDRNVKDYHLFSRLGKPGVDVIEIPKEADGLAYLLSKLSHYQGLSAVHLLSHGASGELLLGSERINSKTLQKNIQTFNVLNSAIAPGGDLLMYGCELAKTDEGENFLEIIKGNTHIDVAASNDRTGNLSYGGDWELEIQKGDIEATPLAESIAMKDFTGVLQTFDFSDADMVNAGGITAADNVLVNETGAGTTYTLVVDGTDIGVDSFTGGFRDYAYLGYDGASGVESSVTLSFVAGSTFDPTSLSIYNFSSGPVQFTFTSDVSGSATSSSLNYSLGEVVDLSVLAANTTQITITGSLSFKAKLDDVIVTNIGGPTNSAPTIGGAVANQAVNDNTTIDPFSGITIADTDNDNVTATITLDNNAKGVLSGTDLIGTGPYSIASSTPAAMQAIIRALTYNPTDNRTATTETTTFTINIDDGTDDTNDANTTVVSSAVAPTVTSVTVLPNATYILGQNLDFTVNFNESITVNETGGTPQLNLTIGATARQAVYNSAGSSGGSVLFKYAVQSGDLDTDGITVGTLSNEGGTLRDAGGRDAVLSLNSVGATTAVLVDGVNPTLSSSVPADEATDVAANSNLELTFSENIVFGTGFIELKRSSDNATVVSIDATNPTATSDQASILNNVLTIDPANALAESTGYYLSISASSIDDLAGNDFPGFTDNATYNFTVVDNTPPIAPSMPDLVTTSDTGSEEYTTGATSDNATNDLTPTFTGTAEANATVTVISNVDGTLGTTTANGTGAWTFTPGSNMTTNTDHNITATATDAAMNTGPASPALQITLDTTSPTVSLSVVSTSNPTNADPIPIRATFSEEVDNFNDYNITLTNALMQAFTFSSADSTVFDFFVYPNGEGNVLVDINFGATQDMVGNYNTVATQFSIEYDATAPGITSITRQTPSSSLTNSNSLVFSIEFSESVSNVDVTDFAPTGTSASATGVSGSGTTYNVTISGGDLASLNGTVSLGFASGQNISDDAGNTLTNLTPTVSNETYLLDNEAPLLTASSPTDDATNVTSDSDITLSFDTNVQFGTGNIMLIDLTDASSSVTIDATSPGSLASISNGVLTINPAANLDLNSNYAVQIASTAIDDLSGNSYAGITNNTTLNFTTGVPTIAFSSTNSYGNESVSSADIEVSLSAVSSEDVTVNYSVTGGTATGSGTDYTLADGTLTILAGNGTNDITIASIVPDDILEVNETVILTLSSPTGATLGTNTQHTFTIYNDDVSTVTIEDVSANEDDGAITVTATLDLGVQGGFTVDVNTADGTATISDGDYGALVNHTLTFIGTAGETQTFTITPTVDSKLEANETIRIFQSNLGTGLPVTYSDEAIVTINNDDAAAVTIADVSGNENDGAITVTATLDNPVSGGFTVDVNTADGTATTADSDYGAVVSQTLTFAGTAGETQTFTVTPTADSKLEGDETLTIFQSNFANNALTVDITDGATVTINGDDAASVTIADISGNEDDGAITVTAILDNAVPGGFTVDVSTSDGTATTADSDYTAVVSQTLTFSGTAGETQTFTVTPTGDTKLEANETVTISQSNLAATALPVSISDGAIVTITNDDAAVVTIANVSGNEDDGAITVTATLDNAVQGGFTVDVSTSDGTATTADSDYSAVVSQTLTFSGTTGETQTFTVTPTGDSKLEANETVTISQSNLAATGLTVDITDGATVTITNDDAASVTIADISGNEDDGAITITATLDNAVEGGFAVDVSTADGTATTADSDYSAVVSQMLTFTGTAGETQTFTVTPTADNTLEDDETLTISQSNLAATTLAVTITDGASVIITNDDNAAVTIADATANEDDGDITITATLSNPVAGGFTVEVNTTDGTATTADSDYSALVSQTLTFSGTAGEAQAFTVMPTADGKVETDENIIVSMVSLGATSFSIDVSDDATVIFTNDDATPVVTASQSFTISENLADASSIGTLVATDADAGTTFQNWIIVSGNTGVDGDSNDAFAINASTGEITVNDSGDLNFESGTTSFTLVVTVSDGDNTSAQENVTITINDVNDNVPVVTTGQNFSIDENLANSTSVGTVVATDADETATTFSAWTITAGNALGIFAIDGSSGEITIADNSSLDREDVASATLSVTVSDGVNISAVENVTININDLNDVSPVVTAGQTFSVSENAANALSLGNVLATDNDVTTTAFSNWTIVSGNTDNVFAIAATTGEITVADNGLLDFESTTSYTLVVTVSDGANTSANENVVITVINDNEQPQITGLVDQTTDEDVSVSTSFTVSDPDTDLADLQFAFTVNDATVFETAEVAVTGSGSDRVLTVSPNLNQFGTTQLTVTVSDGVLSSAVTIDVTVNPVNDAPTSLSLSNQSIDEAVAIGFEIGTFTTEDVDEDDAHEYSLVTGDGDTDNASFGIDGSALELAEVVDFESGATRSIRVRTTDTAGAFFEQTFTITLNANPELELVIKTAFTPNGDGVNDSWIIDNITQHPNARVSIMNREGKAVFKSTGYQSPWNGTFEGKELPVDTYYYVIDLETGGRRYEGFVMILK